MKLKEVIEKLKKLSSENEDLDVQKITFINDELQIVSPPFLPNSILPNYDNRIHKGIEVMKDKTTGLYYFIPKLIKNGNLDYVNISTPYRNQDECFGIATEVATVEGVREGIYPFN